MKQFLKYKPAQGNLSRILQENIHDKIRDLSPPSRIFFLISGVFASSQTQLTERAGECTQSTLPGACHSTLSRAHTLRTPWLKIKLCPRHS